MSTSHQDQRDPSLLQGGLARYAALPLRVIVGSGFMQHGFAKLSKGPDAFAGILHQLNVPAPQFAAYATMGTEILGGAALLLGAFVALVSIPTIFCSSNSNVFRSPALRVQFDQDKSNS